MELWKIQFFLAIVENIYYSSQQQQQKQNFLKAQIYKYKLSNLFETIIIIVNFSKKSQL